jgi:hypothetical protein
MAKQEVNSSELKDCINFAIENSEIRKLPFCIWGYHGIGKTEIVSQVAKDKNMNLVVVHLSTQDITDLIGIPYQKDGVQCWSTPKWLHDANENYKATGKPNLFFLDEMNRGHHIVLKAMLPFLLDGTLHLHSIGPKDCVLAACNPPTDDYEVNDMTDKALLDRLGHVVFKPTHSEYLAYCKSKNIDSTTLSILKTNTKFTSIPKTEISFELKPSRRAIFNVMSVVGKKDKSWVRNRANHILECYLGPEFRDEWITEFVKNDQEVDIEVIQNISKNKDFILSRITKTIDGLRTCAIDVVEKLTNNIKSFISDKGELLSKDDVEWIIEFFSLPIIPAEFPTSVLINNPCIEFAIVKDKNINRMIGEFIEKNKLIPEKVKSW